MSEELAWLQKTLEEAKKLHKDVTDLHKNMDALHSVLNETRVQRVADAEVTACWRSIAKGESKGA